MELYLFTNELPIVLTKPGLLQVKTDAPAATPPPATPPKEKPVEPAPAPVEPPAEPPKDKTAEAPPKPESSGDKDKKEKAEPAETVKPDEANSDPAASIGAGGDPNSNAMKTVQNGLDTYGSSTTGSMDSVFADYWQSDTAFTKKNVRDMREALDKELEVQKKAYKAAAGDEKEVGGINENINWLEDRIARTNYLEDIAGDYESSLTALDNRDFETGRNFLTTYDKKIEELGEQTITQSYLDTKRVPADVATVQEQWENKTGGMMGPQSAGGGGFLKGIQDFNTGVGAVTGTVQGLNALAQSGQQLGHTLSGGYGHPPGYGVYNQGFGGHGSYGGYGGSGGYGGPGGFSGGYGVAAGGFGGGFNLALGGFGRGYGYDDDREQDRKLSAIINMLIFQVARGNIDKISTALIMVARQGKETLRRTAVSALTALQSYERQQSQITDMMQNLNAEGNPNYASQLQSLSGRMNTYSSNRQMIVSLLRDVKSMSDELENMSKSYQDTSLQHQRRQMIFA